MFKFSTFEDFNRVVGTHKAYRTGSTVYWHVGKKDSGWILEIPAGTEFDISVPRWLEWALNPHNRMILLAALVHDVLLKQGFDLSFSSSEFRRCARARGAGVGYAWVLFYATLIHTKIVKSTK